MQSSIAISIGLPVALVIIMLGLGLSLKFDDFTRVFTKPKPIFVGLFCQILLLPLFCLGLVFVSDLPPSIAVGMMLLAASPGGTSATIFTHLARGDVALSLMLAAVTSLLALVTIPIIANVSLMLFYGEANTVYLQIWQVLQIFAVAIVPALVGVYIRSLYPDVAARLDRPVKTLATAFLALVVLFALVSQWKVAMQWAPAIGATVLIFNVASLLVGYYAPRLMGVDRSQTVAITMSVSIHNAALVIALALSEYMLDNAEMAIPPALYGVIAYVTGGVAVWLLNRGPKQTG